VTIQKKKLHDSRQDAKDAEILQNVVLRDVTEP
jgi:hypothetical protein